MDNNGARIISLPELITRHEVLGELADSILRFGTDGHASSMHPRIVLGIVQEVLEQDKVADVDQLVGVVSQLLDVADKKGYFAPYKPHVGVGAIYPDVAQIRELTGLPPEHNPDEYATLLDLESHCQTGGY